MTQNEHDRLDEACIWLLERTSIRSPRQFLADCTFCSLPYWVAIRNGDRQRYCSHACKSAHGRLQHLEAERAADRARYHARRTAA